MLWRLMMLSWGLATLAAATQWRWLALASGLVLAAYLCLALPDISLAGRFLLALLAGLILLLLSQTGMAALEAGLRQAIVFAAFMPTARLMRAAARHDPAIIRIRRNFRRLPPQSRPGWMLYASHALSAMLSIGAFAVLAPLLPRQASPLRLRLAQMALLGGGLSVLWSPFFVAQAFVAHGYPALGIWQIVLTGLCIAAFGLFINTWLAGIHDVIGTLRAVIPALATLLLPIICAVAVVLLLNRLGGYSNIEAMVLAIPPLALLAAWWRRPAHLRALFKQAPRWAAGMGEEIGVVALAILFSAILQYSTIGGLAGDWVRQIGLAPFTVLLIAFLVMVGLEMLGLHPILCATLALQITQTVAGQIPDLLPAMLILVAWSFGSIMSYSGLLPSIAAATFGVAKHQLIYGRNLVYVAVGVMLTCLLLVLLAYGGWVS